MSNFPISYLPWPYAALAVLHFDWVPVEIDIHVIFRFPMDTTVKPLDTVWTAKVDGVPEPITGTVWIDDYRLRLLVLGVGQHPNRVMLKYAGPDPLLRIVWGKQWEPWGWLLALDVTT